MEKLKPHIIGSIVLAALFIGSIVFATFRFRRKLTELVCDSHKFRGYVLSFGPWSAVVFMLFQVLQVVIAFYRENRCKLQEDIYSELSGVPFIL